MGQPEHNLAGYSAQILNRLDTPIPLMGGDPRIRNFRPPPRNHYPVEHESFADDFHMQENMHSVSRPIRPLMDQTQQRMTNVITKWLAFWKIK